ncbi:PAX3- and PAX7-binding protein 1 [Pristis pectinata]|uniref:PAX3- and PAX7-binding protein 1 n=1 Tax=Pristis pectinata TaxID=685728 RepID=UPI00223CE15C|nr:PAX3- and PAX7-binding protein 1 [Pristis pectinata]XP_051870805.1 PAX3- and PAX7-binding protein 1 [Pristis pectinata]
MFKKSRRNFRRRNDSEEEEREDGPSQEPAQAGAGAEAALTNNSHEKSAEPPPSPGICEPGLGLPLPPRPALCAPGLGPGKPSPGLDAAQPLPGLVAPKPVAGLALVKTAPLLDPPKAVPGLGLARVAPAPSAAKLPGKDKKRSREKEVPRAALLSFQDEEEEEEVFKVKKSNYSKKIVNKLKKEYKEDLEKSLAKNDGSSQVSIITAEKPILVKEPVQDDCQSDKGEEEMEVDSDEQDEEGKSKPVGAFANTLSTLNTLRPGEIPDAAFIHAARKRRQLARELGDCPAVEIETSTNRLVREDENDASDDDDEKRRIVFSVKEKTQRQKIAEEIGIEGSDDEALDTTDQDEELKMWEQEQIRKGISVPQVQSSHPTDSANIYYQNSYQAIPYGSSYNLPYTYNTYGATESKSIKTDNAIPFKPSINEMPPVTIDLVKKRLKDRLDSMKEVHKTNQQRLDKLHEDLENSSKTIERLEGITDDSGRYRFFQEMRGYVRDLLECFNEKVPLVNELETAMHQLLKQRATRFVQRRQDDIKDESSEYSSHSSKTVMAPSLDSFGRDRALYQENAKQRRIAEREARRARRRLAREQAGKMAEHHEGLSSDDEETSTDITSFNMENDRIVSESRKVFEDVLDDFCTLDSIKTRFEVWRQMYYTHYKDAYIGLCLPKLLNPLIRLQLIKWNPFEPNCRDFESMLWFESLLFYGCEGGQNPQMDDVDTYLLPAIVEKVVLPKLTGLAEKVWDPLSTSQTSRLVKLLLKLVEGYPSVVNGENKYTQNLLKTIILRIRKSVDEDVFVPLYPKSVLENKNSGPYLFFQRQFWSALKLLDNILQWTGIISNRVLQELTVDSLLNRHILLALQNSDPGDDSLKKCQSLITCLPKSWFANLKGDKSIPQMENFCCYLVHLANTIYRLSLGCSDVEKRTARENIKQVIKFLAIIHALDHATAVANEYGVKDIKTLLDGK